MVSGETTTEVPTTQEAQYTFRSPEDARTILSEHLRLMLEKPNVPWGTTLVWTEGGADKIPSYEGHVISVLDEEEGIEAMVMALIRDRGFDTSKPTHGSSSWTRLRTQISPDSHIDENGKFKRLAQEDRLTITYMGEVSGDYEIYGNEALPGVRFVRAAYSGEKIEKGHSSQAYSEEKAKEYGLKKPEPCEPMVVWRMHRVAQASKAQGSDPEYVAGQRQRGGPEKSGKTAEMLLLAPLGSGWSRKIEASAAGRFG